MTLDKDDLNALGNLIEDSLERRLGKNLEKVSEVVDKRIDDKFGNNLEKVGDVLDKRIDGKMIDFHEKVTAPMVHNLEISLKEVIGKVDDKMDGIERKLDVVTDMLAVRVTDHEKRIIKLERAIA